MEQTDLNRALLWSYFLILGVSLLLFGLWGVYYAAGFLFGGVWCATNLWVMEHLLVEFLRKERRIGWLIFWAQCKLPLLYGVGGVVLMKIPLSIGAAIGGFHVPFAIILVTAIRSSAQDARNAKLTSDRWTGYPKGD
ncbi:MAG: hypothetical protein RBU29_16970 [bacterium]|nr:hypothetical protein [bacterium]